jgi:hypothetical protein
LDWLRHHRKELARFEAISERVAKDSNYFARKPRISAFPYLLLLRPRLTFSFSGRLTAARLLRRGEEGSFGGCQGGVILRGAENWLTVIILNHKGTVSACAIFLIL